jgi:hypothetical protein
MPFFLVVEDFARASIGPFASTEAASVHLDWCQNVRGDGASFIAMRNEHDPEADLTMTPEEDMADTGESFIGPHKE